MFVLYIFSFHRGCARELDDSDSDYGGFGDQCRRFCGRARVLPATRTGTDSEFTETIRAGITPTTLSFETFQW